MKRFKQLLAVSIVLFGVTLISAKAQDNNRNSDLTDSLQQQRTVQNEQAINTAKEAKHQSDIKANEAAKAKRQADAASTESRKALKNEKKAQKARIKADMQTEKARKARQNVKD